MEVKFLSRAQTQATLVTLVEECDSMQWAVAWATENAVFEEAMKCSSKFQHFVVGTHMFQTQPEVLERAAALEAAAVVPPTGDLFHPKVYLFRNGRRAYSTRCRTRFHADAGQRSTVIADTVPC